MIYNQHISQDIPSTSLKLQHKAMTNLKATHPTSNIDSLRFHEIGKLRKSGIGQESIKGLAKFKFKWGDKEGKLDKWRL